VRRGAPRLGWLVGILLALAVVAWAAFVALLVLPLPVGVWIRLKWWEVAGGADPIMAAAASGVIVIAAAAFLALVRPARRMGWSRLELALAIGSVGGLVFLAYVVSAPGNMEPIASL
jgi:hypothetical protein